jgi:hypothetical protein
LSADGLSNKRRDGEGSVANGSERNAGRAKIAMFDTERSWRLRHVATSGSPGVLESVARAVATQQQFSRLGSHDGGRGLTDRLKSRSQLDSTADVSCL